MRRSADEPSRCELISSDGSSAEIKCRSMGTAICCAKRNPKLSEIDEIRVRCICTSVPLRQRTCARGRYLGSSQCLYRNLCNWRESANVLRHRQLANRAAFLTNLVKSIEKSTLMPGRAKDGHSRPTSNRSEKFIASKRRRSPWEHPRLRTECQPSTSGCFDYRRTAGSLKCTG
jgi:hypothetical protein